MGESQIITELRKSHLSDKWKFVVLARFYKIEMQTAFCEDYAIFNSYEEIKTPTTVS